jgi:hypothetical protein
MSSRLVPDTPCSPINAAAAATIRPRVARPCSVIEGAVIVITLA